MQAIIQALPEIHGIKFWLEPLILHHSATFIIFASQYYFVKMSSCVILSFRNTTVLIIMFRN